MAVLDAASKVEATYEFRDAPLEGEIPIGTVEFCAPAFGEHRIDFYPRFLKDKLFRPIMCTTVGQLYRPKFVKDALAWKSDYESKVQPCGYTLPSGCWWVSEPVNFVNEWRYYVVDNDVITTGWYMGDDEEQPAPELDILWPNGFSGAVDFGQLDTGEVALVECHAPFACGWYGEDHVDYLTWLILAWSDRQWWRKGNPEGRV